jgi:hypothetical protein
VAELKLYVREILLILLGCLGVQVFGESRKVVVVIDSGLRPSLLKESFMCKGLSRDFSGYGLADVNGHGTNIIGLIVRKMNTTTHCIALIKYWHDTAQEDLRSSKERQAVYENSLSYANSLKPYGINLSASGFSYYPQEIKVFQSVLARNGFVVVSAGNWAMDLSKGCTAYPACYPIKHRRFYVVGASGTYSNKNGPVNVIKPGTNQCAFDVCLTGTSQSAANQTAHILFQEAL